MFHRWSCGRIIEARRKFQGLSGSETNLPSRGLKIAHFALPLGVIPTKMPSALRPCFLLPLKFAAP
jgi:hypothetical protein